MKLVRWVFLFMLTSAGVIAQDLKVIGSMDQIIKLPSGDSELSASPVVDKHIALLKMELSDKARQNINHRADKALKSNETMATGLAKEIQLGMGAVPVLDQGGFGSCVTFANTAAVDAALNKGDYISQLCLLQLGRYLETNGYVPSGWGGSLGGIVLGQMDVFGLVNKTQQKTNGCGGLTEYPIAGMTSEGGAEMSSLEYHPLSEQMNIGWSSLLDVYGAIEDKVDLNYTIAQVKTSLNAGDRLTFGVLLPAIDRGMAGAIGRFHATNDSWVLTPEVVQIMKTETDFPGHEMVITGYDDDAVAMDDQDRPHKGLFTLRNSWGTRAGDKGDFYMSYDYFKALAIEVQRIRH